MADDREEDADSLGGGSPLSPAWRAGGPASTQPLEPEPAGHVEAAPGAGNAADPQKSAAAESIAEEGGGAGLVMGLFIYLILWQSCLLWSDWFLLTIFLWICCCILPIAAVVDAVS